LPPDIIIIKIQPSFRLQVARHIGHVRNTLLQCLQARHLRPDPCHRFWKRIAQPDQHLKHRQVSIAHRLTHQPGITGRIALKDALEVMQEFRHAFTPKFGRTTQRLRFLIVVIRATADRMMGVMNFANQIGNRQLALMNPGPAGLIGRHQLQSRSERVQDSRNLRDDRTIDADEGRRKRRVQDGRALQSIEQLRHAVLATGHINIIGTGGFECEPDEFAPTLYVGPIVEFDLHVLYPSCFKFLHEHSMEDLDQRYQVRQRKANPDDKDVPVYAKAMIGKTGQFEGVSFIRNKEKASVMTMALAQQVVDWTEARKTRAGEYVTTIICKGQ
jgi:hypothetical protein